MLLEFFLEAFKLTSFIKVPLQFGDVAFTIVAAVLIKDGLEHGQQGINLIFTDDGSFLVDVEKYAFRRNVDRPIQIAFQNGIMGAFFAEDISCELPFNLMVLENKR